MEVDKQGASVHQLVHGDYQFVPRDACNDGTSFVAAVARCGCRRFAATLHVPALHVGHVGNHHRVSPEFNALSLAHLAICLGEEPSMCPTCLHREACSNRRNYCFSGDHGHFGRP